MCNIIGINVLYFIHSIICYSGCRNFSCKKSSFSLSSHGKQTYSNFTFKQLKKVIFLCKKQHKFWNNLIKFRGKLKNLSYSCKFQDFETQGVFNGAECISTIKDTIQTLLQLKFLKKKPFQQNYHQNCHHIGKQCLLPSNFIHKMPPNLFMFMPFKLNKLTFMFNKVRSYQHPTHPTGGDD